MRHERSFASITSLTLFAMVVGAGCQREVEQKCIPLDPSIDYDGPVQRTPFCQWEPGGLPEPPAGYARTYTIFTYFTPTEDEPCDPCDIERFEALLQGEVAQTCSSLDYTGLTVSCYRPPENEGDTCSVMGIYFTNYQQVPFEHGCEPLPD